MTNEQQEDLLLATAKATTLNELRQAASNLSRELRDKRWFRFIGIDKEGDEDILIVYVKKKETRSIVRTLPQTWGGIRTVVRYIEDPIPGTSMDETLRSVSRALHGVDNDE